MKRCLILLFSLAIILCSCLSPNDNNASLTPGENADKVHSSISASLSPTLPKAIRSHAVKPLSIDLRSPFFVNDKLVFADGTPQLDVLNFKEATHQVVVASNSDTAPVSSALNPMDPKLMATIDPDRPVIALTFDDGPGPYTEQILDILAENNARATFFVVGNRIESYPEAIEAIIDEGSEIGNHTWSHAFLTKLDEQNVREQLQWTVDEVEKVTGVKPVLLRPPYGSLNDSVTSIIAEMGMPIITWSIDTLDWQTKDPHKTYDSIMGSVTNGCIILCHDIHEETAQAMITVIPALVQAGYQLVTVSELLTFVEGGALAGTVYRSVK